MPILLKIVIVSMLWAVHLPRLPPHDFWEDRASSGSAAGPLPLAVELHVRAHLVLE